MGTKNTKQRDVTFTKNTIIHNIARGLEVSVTPTLITRRFTVVRFIQHKWSMLHLAVWLGRTDLLQTLISSGVRLDEKDAHGDTALFLAAFQNNSESYQILIDAGADPCIANHV